MVPETIRTWEQWKAIQQALPEQGHNGLWERIEIHTQGGQGDIPIKLWPRQVEAVREAESRIRHSDT